PFPTRRSSDLADCVHELALERDERAVRPGSCAQALDGRVAVACGEILLAPAERTAHRPSRLSGQGDRDVRLRAGAVLGAEAAAHEVADHAYAVGGQAELLGNR